jgi:hypothetical protein
VEDTEAVVHPEQEDRKNAESVGMTNRECKKPFKEIMVAIGDRLRHCASSDDEENGDDDEDEDTGQGKLSEDDKPGLMGTTTKMVQQGMEWFQYNQMKVNKLRQPGWENAVDYFRKRDKKSSTSELMVPAVIHTPTDDYVVAPGQKTFGVHMVSLYIVPRMSQMAHGTSQPGSSNIELGSV